MLSGVIAEPSSRNPTVPVPQTIPTQDAEAALAFCRAFAQMLNGSPLFANTSAVQAGLNRPLLVVRNSGVQ